MSKRILLITLVITVVGVVAFSILSANAYYNSSLDFVKKQLVRYMQEFDETAPFSEQGADEFSEKLFGARVTYIFLDGTVIGDSVGSASDYENHKERDEVEKAMEKGKAFSVRNSSSADEDMLYYCVKIDKTLTLENGERVEGALVRIAMRTESLWAVFADSLPTLIWVLLIVIVICLFLSYLATSFILKPVEKLTREMATSGGKHVSTGYSELKPLAKLMNGMSDDIQSKAKELSADSQLKLLILNSMEHGIVIFRSASDIVLINRTAAKLLDYEKNEPIRAFFEDIEIKTAIESEETASFSKKIGTRDYMFRFTKVETARVLLITDITETVAAANSKNEFISNVTHEMNTPLTSIKGFAELISTGALDDKSVQNAANTILKQSERLTNLVRSIINFSAIDNDELEPYSVDLTALVNESVSLFEPSYNEKKIQVTLSLSENVCVISRRERLFEILNNLISNGIRYNKEGGKLDITLTGGKTPELIVSDTGVGISEENLPHIFSRFYTVDKSHNGSGGGFGLGLAIVKKLCLKAGWKLSVESKLGEGTTFKIKFISQ